MKKNHYAANESSAIKFALVMICLQSSTLFWTEASAVPVQERVRKLTFSGKDISPTIVYIGAKCWRASRNWHDIRPTSAGKYLVYNSAHNSGTEFANAQDWPKGLYIPSHYRGDPGTWLPWQKGKPGEILGLKVENYARVQTSNARGPLKVPIEEQLSVTKDLNMPLSLLKFFKEFYGCETALGFPLRDLYITPGGASSKATSWLMLQQNTWENVPVITFPTNVRLTKDWYDVVTGGTRDFDVLYQVNTPGKKGK